MTKASAEGLRHLAIALGIGAVAAVFVDAALQNALAAVQSPGAWSTTPWWVIGRVTERATLVAAAVLAWLLAPGVARALSHLWPAGHRLSRPAAFDAVGRAMIVVPLVWLVALWLVWTARMTLTGSWSTEGRIFLSSSYYTNVLLAYAPWAGGGITLLTLRRHLTDA